MSILATIADHSTAVIALCVPGLLISGGYVVWKILLAPAPTAGSPVGSIARAASSIELGQAKHQQRAEAKTIKFATPQADRDERLIDTTKVGQPADDNSPQRRAEKMEKLGFHAPARSTTPAPASDTEQVRHQAALANAAAETISTDLTRSDLLPTIQPEHDQTSALAAPHVAASKESQPATERVQTQDLDDILSRIDRVLAENPVMATTTLSPGSVQAPVQPLTETTPKPQG